MSTSLPGRWRRALASVTALAVVGLGLATAAPAAQAAGTVTTEATATTASAADGLAVKVSGTGYFAADLPPATAFSAGVYVAVIAKGADPLEVKADYAKFVKTADIVDGSFTVTTPAIPVSALDSKTDYEVMTWRAHGNPEASAIIDRTAIALTAEQREALFPTPKPTTQHSVAVAEKTGLSVTVTAKNYDASKYPGGLHAAIIDRKLSYAPAPAQSEYLGVTSPKVVDGAFTSTPSVTADKLDASKDYDVIVWPGRSNPNDSNVAYRSEITLTSAQRATLFPPVTPEPEPADRPITINATDFVNLPASTTGIAAGAYVGIFAKGTKAAEITSKNALGGAAYVKPADIVDGAFTRTITIPGANAKDALQVIAWPAHGNATDANIIDRKDLAVTATSVDLKGPGAPAPVDRTITVNGTDYVNLPLASTGKENAGVYVATFPASVDLMTITSKNYADFAVAPASYIWSGNIKAGAFTTTQIVPAAKAKDKLVVAIWTAHGDLTKDTLVGSQDLPLDATALDFKGPGAPAPVDRTITINGTDYVNLPEVSAGQPAAGAYVTIIKKGTALADVADNNIAQAWIMPNQIKDGAFTKDLTIPAAKNTGEFEVISWSAHGNPTDANMIDRKDLTATATSVDLKGPGAVAAVERPITINATDFVNLPASTTGYAAGAYVGVFAAGTKAADVTAKSAIGGAAFVPTTQIINGAFTTKITVPAANAKDALQVIAWPAHGNATDANIIDRKDLTATATSVDLKGPGASNPGTETPEGTVKDATLNWGLKESFRKYMLSDLAHGTVEASNGATQAKDNGIFSFTGGAGELKDGKGTLAFNGKLHFLGHDGQMDLTYTNVRVKLTSATTGVVILDASAPASEMSDAIDAKNVEFAKLTFPAGALKLSGTTLELKDAAATLTTDGSAAVAEFYPAGERLDALSINAVVTPVVVKPTPTPTTPTEPTEPADETFEVSNAQLSWGIKESFRKYVAGPIADGAVTVKGAKQAKNNGEFVFGGGKGTLVNGLGELAFDGSVNFAGHHGEMDFTLSNFRVNFTSATTADLILDAKAPKSSMTDAIDLKNVVFAKVTFESKDFLIAGVPMGGKAATSAGKKLILTNAKTTLTAAGAPAMAGFYDAGTQLDALSINGSAKQTESTPDATDGGTDNGADNGTDPGTDATNNGGKGTPAQQCRTVQVAATSGGASLNWGVKSSFVSYVKGGIAKGSVSAGNGASANGSGFSWGAGSGSLDANGLGTVAFPGSVHFSGHDGLLDTTLSGLRVKVTGNGKAVLIANVKSQDMEGKDLSASGIVFANISFSGGSQSGFSGASVTLTAAGAKSFAGFYNAGQAMDSLSLSVGKSSPATSKVVCGDLAATGSNGSGDLVAMATLLGLMGALAIGMAARRRSYSAQH